MATHCPYSSNQNIVLKFKIYFKKIWSRLYYRKWRLLKFFVFIKRSWKQLLSSIDDTWKSSLILKKSLRSLCNIVFFDLYFSLWLWVFSKICLRKVFIIACWFLYTLLGYSVIPIWWFEHQETRSLFRHIKARLVLKFICCDHVMFSLFRD